jgi:hypothetical protein
MYGTQGDYQMGTQQNLGVQVFGETKKEQCTGVMDVMLKRYNVIEDRNDRCRSKTIAKLCPNGVHDYEGPAQLNILEEDMIFVAKKDVPGVVCQMHDSNPFASFNGLPMFTTPHDYRLRYRFLGMARTAYAFDNDCQGKGFTLGVSGIFNFLNRTDDTMMPGDLLTWEPDFSDFATARPEFKSKKQHSAGSTVVKGRFVKYEPVRLDDTLLGRVYPSLKTWLDERKIVNGSNVDPHEDEKIDMVCGLAAGRDVIARCEECTHPNEYGRVRLGS